MKNKKDIIRSRVKDIRRGLNVSLCSEKIVEHLQNWDVYSSSQNVMLFYPINTEISLLSLLKDKSKVFSFPSVVGDEICPIVFSENNGFKAGCFNINEPENGTACNCEELDLIVVPALCADSLGYRIGYGKGFYDRFLNKISSRTKTIIPVFSELLYDFLPCESHDQSVDYVVTEKGVITVNKDLLSG